jgi:hypothetical protein
MAPGDGEATMRSLGGVLVDADGLLESWRVPVRNVGAAEVSRGAVRPEANFLRLRGLVIDTETLRLAGPAPPLDPSVRLKVVQMAGRPQPRDWQALSGAGFRTVAPIPEHGLVVWSPDEERDRILEEIAGEHSWRYRADFPAEAKFLFDARQFDDDWVLQFQVQLAGPAEDREGDLKRLKELGAVWEIHDGLDPGAIVEGRWRGLRDLFVQLPTVLSVSLPSRVEPSPDEPAATGQPPSPWEGNRPWLLQALRVDPDSEDRPQDFPTSVLLADGFGQPGRFWGSYDPFHPEGPDGGESPFRSRRPDGAMLGPSRIDFALGVNTEGGSLAYNLTFAGPRPLMDRHAPGPGQRAAHALGGDGDSPGVAPWARLASLTLADLDEGLDLHAFQFADMLAVARESADTTAALAVTSSAGGERFQVSAHPAAIAIPLLAVHRIEPPLPTRPETTYGPLARAADAAARRTTRLDGTTSRRGILLVFPAPADAGAAASHALGKNALVVPAWPAAPLPRGS